MLRSKKKTQVVPLSSSRSQTIDLYPEDDDYYQDDSELMEPLVNEHGDTVISFSELNNRPASSESPESRPLFSSTIFCSESDVRSSDNVNEISDQDTMNQRYEDDEEVELFPTFPYERWESDHKNWSSFLERIQHKIVSHRASKYLIEFDDDLSTRVVTICSIEKHDLDETRFNTQEHVQQEQEMKRTSHMKKLTRLKRTEMRVNEELSERKKERDKIVSDVMKEMDDRNEKLRSQLSKAFHNMEGEMTTEMGRRKKTFRDTYGAFRHRYNYSCLCTALSNFYSSKFERQEVKISLRYIRGMKDKIPQSKYAIVVSIRDGISGREVVGGIDQSLLSKLKGKILKRSEGPFFSVFYHNGTHCTIETTLDSTNTIQLLLPSQLDRKPHYVYSFEIVKLSGENAGACVGWGVYPVENPEFKIIDGNCKTPLVRGWVDSAIDQYCKIEDTYCEDLDCWMGNLYFSIHAKRLLSNSEAYELLEESHDQHLWGDELDTTERENKSEKSTESDFLAPTSEELSRYKYEIKNSYKASVVHQALGRIRFVLQTVTIEMGFLSPLSLHFMFAILMMLVAFWMRIFVHYFGQWCILKFFKTPDILYKPTGIRVTVVYESNYLSLAGESLVIISGAMTNIIILLIMIGVIGFFQKMRVNVPFFASRFIVAYGLLVILDPILILIVDCCYKDWRNGDSFKLYRKLADERSDSPNSPIWGIFITISMHLWTMLISVIIIHFFCFRVFMNGLLLDAYKRLFGKRDDFFVPGDQELSYSEFEYIIQKSLRYRSEHGDFRRVVALEYTTSHSDNEVERTIHILIYTMTEDKSSHKLFRQFLWHQDGTLEELFTGVSSLYCNSDVSKIIEELLEYGLPNTADISRHP